MGLKVMAGIADLAGMDLATRCAVAVLIAGSGVAGGVSLARLWRHQDIRPALGAFVMAFMLLVAAGLVELVVSDAPLELFMAGAACACALSGRAASKRIRAASIDAGPRAVGARIGLRTLSADVRAVANGQLLTELRAPVVVVEAAGGDGIELCQN